MKLFDSYDVLILGPGGMKGFIELGALKKLEEVGLLKNIKTFCGVSIGSIIALLLSCRYSVMDILFHAYSMSLLDMNNIDAKNIVTGLFTQNSFEKKLETLIKDKLKINYIPTLKQLHEFTGYEFSAIATALMKPYPQAINLNYKTHPELSVIKAVMMSSNIPGLFKKIEYENIYYVDGGLSCPLPLEFYGDEKKRILSISILTHASDNKVFNDITNYMYISLNVPMLFLTRKYAEEAGENCSNIIIEASLDNPKTTKVDDKDKNDMFMLGFEHVKKIVGR